MSCKTRWLAVVAGALMVFAGAASAQTTTTTETKSFEVVSVDGNKVVLKGAEGARELTVPDDFRFNVDGRPVSVRELKPGMKGLATITTKTTTTPVHVTEVRNGEVMRVTGNSVIIRSDDGYRMFDEGDLAKRNVQILRDGKPVKLSALSTGDRLTATIVTAGEPKVMTERQVQANLAPEPKSNAPAAASPAATAAPATESGAAAPAAPAAYPGEASPAKLPKTASPLPLLGLIGAASLALGSTLAWRRRRG